MRQKRQTNRLNDLSVRSKGKGKYCDGGGLWLVVDETSARRWVFIYRNKGKQREMGLGPYPIVSLSKARELAKSALLQLRVDRLDPIDTRRKLAAKESTTPTFGEFADAELPDILIPYKNEKHKHQWKQTLSNDYCLKIRQVRIDEVSRQDVLDTLLPIWNEKHETAARLRGRIETILARASAKGLRNSENPATLTKELKQVLRLKDPRTIKHHPALPYPEIPQFYQLLVERDSVSALALRFLILTATRVNEVINATWDEINLTNQVWTIPASRMKAKVEHQVPLSPEAIRVLEKAKSLSQLSVEKSYIFHLGKNKPISNMAFSQLYKRMKVSGFSSHGFRSGLRDWVGEKRPDISPEIAEMALAHKVGTSVQQAYRRLRALEPRRDLMNDWATFCASGGTSNKV